MKYTIKENALVITVTPEEQAELLALPPEGEDGNIQQDSTMCDFLEPLVCNGLSWVNPSDIGAMTEAPILSEHSMQDNGKYEDDAVFYYFNAYMLRSPLVDLRDHGSVTFDKA